MTVIRLCLLFVVLSSHVVCGYWFGHDRAARAASRGDWQKSREYLNKTLSYSPDNPALLYDAGVAEYKLGNFKQAHDYFMKVQSSNVDASLKEKAYFNNGNAHVSLKEYKEAIDSYNHVLEMNQGNERAARNLAKAQQLLKQQEEQQKQEQKKEKEKEKKDQEQKKQEQEQKGDSQKQESDDKKKNDQGHDQSNKDQENKGDKGQPGSHNKDKHESDAGKSDGKEGNEDQDGGAEQQSGGEQSGEQEQKKANQQQGMAGEHKEQAIEASERKEEVADVNEAQRTEKKVDKKLAVIMQDQEKRDAKRTKGYIKGMVGKQLTRQDGQHNW